MSHSHRDDLQLVSPEPVEPEPVEVPPPAPVVANADAERRAQEKRKLEGIGEQTTQHQFTGDLPDPDRGGTEIETRLVGGGSEEDDDDARFTKSSSARRGPPPPRFEELEAIGSWAAPRVNDVVTPPAHNARSWAR
jgi:hypothetical protein